MPMSSADHALSSVGWQAVLFTLAVKLANYQVIRKVGWQKKKRILTSSVDEAGSRMIRVNINVFRQVGDPCIHFKVKITLTLCVFSGSDVGCKWRLLYSLLHPTTKHLKSLNLKHLVFPFTGVGRIVYSSLSSLGAGLRLDGLVNHLSWEQSVQNYVILTGISEQPDLKKKNTGWIFIIIGWMWTHTSNTHLCSKNLK